MSITSFSFTFLLVHLDYKPLPKIFIGHTDNEICNTWGIETTAIPICVKVKHMEGIANSLADSVSILRAVDLCHNLNSKDHQQEFSSPFETLPPIEQVNQYAYRG